MDAELSCKFHLQRAKLAIAAVPLTLVDHRAIHCLSVAWSLVARVHAAINRWSAADRIASNRIPLTGSAVGQSSITRRRNRSGIEARHRDSANSVRYGAFAYVHSEEERVQSSMRRLTLHRDVARWSNFSTSMHNRHHSTTATRAAKPHIHIVRVEIAKEM